MTTRFHESSLLCALTVALLSCSKAADSRQVAFAPSEVIDLGALVTEDLPQHMWGKAFLKSSQRVAYLAASSLRYAETGY